MHEADPPTFPKNWLFERFRQEAGALSRSQPGLGLGLAIVRQLVELHGGTVGAESPGEGQGATFTVSLPIPPLIAERRSAEKDDGGAASPRPDRTALQGLRVLVVEDEPDARETLVAVLAQYGAEVTAAASADEAMEGLERAIPDILMSDVTI
jgi:Histidine kinase-, DNA gyrase B-, and HSP90-like ATPase/Response regulator receiver domain